MVVCRGNELHVVYDDRVEEDTTVWYSNRRVDAPHIDQQQIPGPALQAVAVLDRASPESDLPQAIPLAESPGETEADSSGWASAQRPADPLALIAVPIVAAVLLVGGIVSLSIIVRGRK
jgi:hypothetical protein